MALQAGDRVVLIPLRGGGYACLALDGGGDGPLPPGTYYLDAIRNYNLGPDGYAGSLSHMLGDDDDTHTHIGSGGWVEATWDSRIDLRTVSEVTVCERTLNLFTLTINPNDYIFPNARSWAPVPIAEHYSISFIYHNIIRIQVTGSGSGAGNICWAKAVVP